ncbi:MAG: NAD+ synthase [Nitrososphaeraceae archaeon]|nr:NAD+ synthase [Nitrososphaeraceae archaeon]MDW0192248.1 NAD+ synthase [Nitrososphaeraceae archaeon]MDW0225287.1 NAD+ synthase [Nitrososphaeraceae archaeon]MDW0245241.1 NAD+ synthase [Nitrososphaeraceae archaeon]
MSDDFLTLDYGKVAKKITNFISSQVKSRKKNGIVIGLSGGIDSSVCVILAYRALGNKGIIGLSMPEKDVTPKTNLQNARSLAKKLKIRYNEINIECGKRILLNKLPRDKLAGGNFSARLRMTLLYYYAATNNLLVLGTADKSELMTGYFTKFGDEGADIFPIGELYKSQVRLLGKELQIPEQILQQPSSPGFWKGQLAEKEIGLPYSEIDRILESYLRNHLNRCEFGKRKIKLVTDMIRKNQHKKDGIPICNPF